MPLIPLGYNRGRLEVHALVDLQPAPGEPDELVPQLTRAQVGDLIGQLDGTHPGHRLNHHADIARITWADDGVNLTITHRDGTDQQRVSHVAPDERGLYRIALDAVAWVPKQGLTGLHLLEWTLARLDRTGDRINPPDSTAPLALAAVGEVIAGILVDARTEPQHVIDRVGNVVSGALQRLCLGGDTSMAFSFAHAVTMQAGQLREPVMKQLTTAATSRERHDTAGTVCCATCGSRTLIITARYQPVGWQCPLCTARSEQVRP
jgi:hypothetical protein